MDDFMITKNPFYVLGIESSANKIGVGILKIMNENVELLANERKTYTPAPGAGVIPIDAAKHHRDVILELIDVSLQKSNLVIQDIDLYAYTKGPGMYQLLVVGCVVARTLALYHNKPLVPVNHCVAHIEMGRFITGAKNPIVLYASGGNTQIINRIYGKTNKYKIFGETIDVAVGNCFDKIARALGLDNAPSPGFNIEKQAELNHEKKYIPLPYTIKGMDMSFSGILSTCLKLIKDFKSTNPSSAQFKKFISEICFSLQETMFSILVEATERCCSFVESNEVLIVGGVGCNLRLQEMIHKMITQRGGTVYSMNEAYCIDNGAMIAYTGYLIFKHQSKYVTNLDDCYVTQRFRTDSVDITWK